MTKINDSKPELRDIESITPYALNAKKHAPDQVKRLAQSIKKFGWRGNPIIVDGQGVIISGHGRRLAALQLGLKVVPVVTVTDMTAEEARAFRLADNRAAISDLDNDILREELLDLGTDLLEDIFDKKELDFAVADLMEINDDVFVSDLDSVMSDQQATTERLISDVADKRMSVARVLGFAHFTGADAIHVTRLLAHMEAETGLTGEQAFVAFAKSYAGE